MSVETEDFVKDAIFKMDGTVKDTVNPVSEGWNTTISYTYDIKDDKEHNIEIQINPKKEEDIFP